MKKYVHAATALVVAASFAVSASGIASASSPQSSTTPPKLQKGVTLSIWDYFANTDPRYPAFQKVLQAFTAKTGIQVSQPQNPTNSNSKFALNAPTGNAPDLIGVPHDQIAQLQSSGVLAPVPAWAWTPAEKKGYVKAAVQATTLAGKTYAMPWSIQTTGLFYNKALISSSAFKPAKGDKYVRWSTLLPKLQKLTNLGAKKYGFDMDMDNFYYDYAFLSGYGGYVFKYTSGKGYNWKQLGLDSPAAVKAIQFYASLSDSGKYKLVPATLTGTATDSLFEQGQAAVEWSGPWNEGNFSAQHINYGFAPLPSYDGKHPLRPFSTIQVYAVNKYSKHINEAFALLSYITKNMELPVFKASGDIPVIKTELASKTVQSNSIARELAAAALSASPIPNIAEMQQVWTPAANDWQQVAEGKATAAQAAKVSQSDINSAIAKAHGG